MDTQSALPLSAQTPRLEEVVNQSHASFFHNLKQAAGLFSSRESGGSQGVLTWIRVLFSLVLTVNNVGFPKDGERKGIYNLTIVFLLTCPLSKLSAMD